MPTTKVDPNTIAKNLPNLLWILHYLQESSQGHLSSGHLVPKMRVGNEIHRRQKVALCVGLLAGQSALSTQKERGHGSQHAVEVLTLNEKVGLPEGKGVWLCFFLLRPWSKDKMGRAMAAILQP